MATNPSLDIRVSVTRIGEVAIDHPDFLVIFTPANARALASLLRQKAKEAEAKRRVRG